MTHVRASLVVLGCLVLSVAVMIIASANRESYGPLRLARVDGETRYVPVVLPRNSKVDSQPAAIPATPEAVPRAQTPEREFGFGVVEPLRTHRHTFEIRNVGTAPLTIFDPGSSCKCLTVTLADQPVPPGEVGRVVVAWNAMQSQDVFLQRATVATNDPAHPRVQFTVSGRVRSLLAASPSELNARRVMPDKPTTVGTDLISEVWDQFEIEDVRSNLAGLEWSVAPTPSDQLHELRAKAGWRLSVTLPPGTLGKSADETLVVRARPVAAHAGDPADDAIEREIPFHATVIRRIAVYGDGVTPWGAIQIGQVDANFGCERRLLVKVNDVDPRLTVVETSVQPAFVQAEFSPNEQLHKPGYYQLRLRIPPTGASGVFQGEQQGKLKLTFSHPRIKSLEMGLEFVLGPGGQHHVGQHHNRIQPGS